MRGPNFQHWSHCLAIQHMVFACDVASVLLFETLCNYPTNTSHHRPPTHPCTPPPARPPARPPVPTHPPNPPTHPHAHTLGRACTLTGTSAAILFATGACLHRLVRAAKKRTYFSCTILQDCLVLVVACLGEPFRLSVVGLIETNARSKGSIGSQKSSALAQPCNLSWLKQPVKTARGLRQFSTGVLVMVFA